MLVQQDTDDAAVEPVSPAASATSFESCSTMNAIATLDDEPGTSLEGDDNKEDNHSGNSSPRPLGSHESNLDECNHSATTARDDQSAVSSSRRSASRNSTESNPFEVNEPNSPSHSQEPVLDRAASVAGHATEENEKALTSRTSTSSDIHSEHKESYHPMEWTGETYRDDPGDDEDKRSLSSDRKGSTQDIELATLSTGARNALDTRRGHDDEAALAPPDGGVRAYLNVVGGFLVLFASFGYTNAFGVYQAYYSQTIYRTYSDSAISWIGSVQLCLFFLLALVAGPLFDKGKFRYLIAIGSIVQIASIFLIPECHKFWQTMLVQGVMSGVGIGLCFLPALSVQSHWFLKRRAFAIGIVTCGSSFGGIAFPIMLNKLFANRDVGFTDGVRASGYVVAACLVTANLIMSPHPARLIANKPPLPPLRKIMTPTFACMTGGAFLLNWGLWMPLFYLQIYAQSKGVPSDLSFYTLAIYNAGSIFGRTIPNLAADHLGPQNIQSFCCVSAGIALYCMFAAVYGFLSGGFISLVSPAIISISDDISEIGLRQGVAFLIVAGGAVGGNPVCGKLLGHGNRQDPFLAPIMFAGTMALLGGIVTTWGRFLRAKQCATWKV
ncbi:MCT family MFS transporter [Sporobolomyces koalae]|uniref:MCT family MFS transporter n=1 Tax=Sporobolomyces koalae TaxID=500713 RepID=UPI003179BE40